MKKVIIFSLKSEKGVYAFSICKEFATLFEQQRNMKLFKKSVVEMDKYEFMAFSNNMSSYMIIKDYLDDGGNDIEIACTVNESNSLTESCEYISNTIESIKYSMKHYPLKKKYLKLISELTDSIIESVDNDLTLNINTFKLFYHLFRNTFSEYDDIEEDTLKLDYLMRYGDN